MKIKFWQIATVFVIILPAVCSAVTPGSFVSKVRSGMQSDERRSYDYALKARRFSDNGELERAIVYCGKSIASNPGYGYAYSLRANCYFKKMDYMSAKADCDQALSLNPNDTFSLVLRARSFANLSRVDEAIADCDTAIRLDPELAGAYGCKGFAYLMQHHLKDAIKSLTKAIELDSSQSNFYMWRAHAYQQLQQLDKAKADAAQAKKLMPNYAYIDLLIANLNTQSGDYQKAFEVVDKLIAQSPNDIFALNAKSYMLSTIPDKKYRDGKEAVRLGERALKLSPDNTAIMDTLACAYAEDGQFDKAVKLAEKLVAVRGDDKFMAEHLTSFKNGKPWRDKSCGN
jgi:tetratricopeptide (TPR) repeat protein